MTKSTKATVFGLLANIFLFVIKLVAGLISGSLAILSDAINSLSDIVTAVAVMIGVKVARKRADVSHPFGHRRAEPIAGLIVAIFAAVLGFEVIRKGIMWLFVEKPLLFGYFAVIVLLVSVVLKSFMFFYFKKTSKDIHSPALSAYSIDSRNDAFISLIALIGFIGGAYGIGYVDSIAAIVIGLFIIYTGYKIAVRNIDYLVGASPSDDLMRKIKRKAKVKGVKGIHDVKAHYVGDRLHVAIHIELDKRMTMHRAHTIGEKVEDSVGSLGFVEKVFVHIDPVA